MAQITINELRIGFGGPPVLDGISFQVERGQRIGLLGRNGAGKSTLLRLLAGQTEAPDGDIVFSPGTTAALLPQEVPNDIAGSIADVVSAGLARRETDLSCAWMDEDRVARVLSRMELDAALPFETLSSGMKRRALLARTLVSEPDVLLLDEPTNHLDIQAIDWIEQFLLRWDGTLIFVTHDRVFLQKLANRILELDRGRLFDWSCDYDTFLRRKEDALAAEEKQNILFDKKLASEEVWIRQGIKARRTRNEGRVRALKQLRRERSQRRDRTGQVRMQVRQEQNSGRLVAQLKNIAFSYGQTPLFHDFSTTIMRGDKIGIIGPNGIGKTTLMRVLLGQLAPTEGSVRLGVNLQIAYFDQMRSQLDEDKTVYECVADGSEWIQVGGKKKHVIGYLQDFLFTPERARTLIRFSSGGERNRVLLARLFAKPANVLVLDEPTNDLDTETLELLEELLVGYSGTVLMVSHDRAFLNNVVTSSIVFENGGVKEYVGGYDDWLRQRAVPASAETSTSTSSARTTHQAAGKVSSDTKRDTARRRLSYHETRQLAALPGEIERLESELAAMHATMVAADYYKRPPDEIRDDSSRLKEIEGQLTQAYAQWEELEARSELR